MMKRMELLLEQITAGSARPDWTLFALSSLLSATLVLATHPLVGEPSTVGSSDKSELACSNPLVAEEAKAIASSGLIAAKCP
jgi:hypothetical protein